MDFKKSGKVISTVRKRMGITQKQLAAKLGISDKTISKWETGKGMPELALMMPLCDEINITADELLRGELKKQKTKFKG